MRSDARAAAPARRRRSAEMLCVDDAADSEGSLRGAARADAGSVREFDEHLRRDDSQRKAGRGLWAQRAPLLAAQRHD